MWNTQPFIQLFIQVNSKRSHADKNTIRESIKMAVQFYVLTYSVILRVNISPPPVCRIQPERAVSGFESRSHHIFELSPRFDPLPISAPHTTVACLGSINDWLLHFQSAVQHSTLMLLLLHPLGRVCRNI